MSNKTFSVGKTCFLQINNDSQWSFLTKDLQTLKINDPNDFSILKSAKSFESRKELLIDLLSNFGGCQINHNDSLFRIYSVGSDSFSDVFNYCEAYVLAFETSGLFNISLTGKTPIRCFDKGHNKQVSMSTNMEEHNYRIYRNILLNLGLVLILKLIKSKHYCYYYYYYKRKP